MPFPFAALLPSLISAGGSLISGLMGDNRAKQQNAAQVKAIRDQNAYTKKFNRIQMEREDNRIQRLVADARAAGIHPLAALGSSAAGGSFAMPEAAFGGAPITGSAVGDAIKSFGDNLSLPDEETSLRTALLKAQIRNVDASTADLLAQATTRSTVAQATAKNMLGPVQFIPNQPGAAQKAQDDFGDIWEQVFGSANFGKVKIPKPEQLGPLSYNFYRFLLGEDFESDTGK